MEEKEQPHCQRKDYVAWQTAGDKLKGETMRNEENLVGSVLFILGVAALGYAMHVTSKMNKLCAKLDLSVDELSESIDISMPDAIVKEAVDRAADRAAYKAVQSATVTAVNQVRHDIQKEVKTAVDSAYADLRGKVEREISDQIGNIDISSIKRDVIKKAGEKAAEKFESDLEDILEKYNSDLNNVSKIYNSIAKSISSRDDSKEMTFRIA